MLIEHLLALARHIHRGRLARGRGLARRSEHRVSHEHLSDLIGRILGSVALDEHARRRGLAHLLITRRAAQQADLVGVQLRDALEAVNFPFVNPDGTTCIIVPLLLDKHLIIARKMWQRAVLFDAWRRSNGPPQVLLHGQVLVVQRGLVNAVHDLRQLLPTVQYGGISYLLEAFVYGDTIVFAAITQLVVVFWSILNDHECIVFSFNLKRVHFLLVRGAQQLQLLLLEVHLRLVLQHGVSLPCGSRLHLFFMLDERAGSMYLGNMLCHHTFTLQLRHLLLKVVHLFFLLDVVMFHVEYGTLKLISPREREAFARARQLGEHLRYLDLSLSIDGRVDNVCNVGLRLTREI